MFQVKYSWRNRSFACLRSTFLLCSAGFISAWEERPVTAWLCVLPAPLRWIGMRAKAGLVPRVSCWFYTELGVFRTLTEAGFKFCFVFASEHSLLWGSPLRKADIAD